MKRKKKQQKLFLAKTWDMQKNAFQNFEKSQYTVVYSCFQFPALLDNRPMLHMKTTSKRRKRWICCFPKQNSLIIFITHSLFFQEVISLTAIALFHSELPLGHLRVSLINGHSYKPSSSSLQN